MDQWCVSNRQLSHHVLGPFSPTFPTKIPWFQDFVDWKKHKFFLANPYGVSKSEVVLILNACKYSVTNQA